jgi:hypothetical protein
METHAPTKMMLVLSLVLIVLAILCFLLINVFSAFWLAVLAYFALLFGTVVRT